MPYSKVNNFKLILDINKSFGFTTGTLSKEMQDSISSIGISNDIPQIFKDMSLEQGVYSYGIATTDSRDSEGEIVKIEDNVFSKLIEPPYNKIFISHKNEDIASGLIKFAGRVPEFENKFMILEKINEYHPNFMNIVGSIKNGTLDSYSVAGSAEYDPINKVRKVTALREVSRCSCPANPDAQIQGLFFVKTLDGGYEYLKEEEKDMIKIEDIEKVFTTKLGEFEQAMDKKMNDKFESFKKDMEGKFKKSEEEEEESETEEDKKDDEVEKAMKAPLTERKSIAKVMTKEDVKKTIGNQADDILKKIIKGERRSLFGGA